MAGFIVRRLEGSHLWSISASYWSPKLNAAAKPIPGMFTKNRAWCGYVDAVQLAVERVREMGLNSDAPPENDHDYSHNLPVSYDSAREYQKIGIDFLICNASSGALLADDMGVGKSFQATKAARALRRKTLIVCPAHVRGVWERERKELGPDDKGGEIAKWWPEAKVFRPYGLTAETIPTDVDVVVVHYDIVHAWVEEILEWAAVESRELDEDLPKELGNSRGRGPCNLTCIFDEAQVLLNPTSRRTKACREIAYEARGRIALTGTPPTDRVRDLYSIIEVISPGRFGDFFPYGKRYCDAKMKEVAGPGGTIRTVWDFDGKSNLKELRKRLDWFCLRRTKREVLSELPAMTRQVVDVEIPSRNRTNVTANIVGDKKRMRAALDGAADGKFKHVLALVRDHLEAGERVVVGTYRRAVCEKLAAALNEVAPTSFIHGGVALPNRGKIIHKLEHIEGPCCLVANIDATSTGVDFTFASKIVFAELVWEPRDLVQFEARSHRFGQDEPVLIQYVIARGTGDELILHAVINKLDNFLGLIESDEGDGLRETLAKKDEGLSRLAAALRKMGKRSAA